MKGKKLLSLAAALVLGALLLWALQLLLVPKYMTRTPEGALIAEYYANAGNNDVIFIGDCEVYENFSPVTLWEEFGISSYIRGSAQQMIWQSYYLLEETLTYETPKVVVFNVLSMSCPTNESAGSATQQEAYNRMTLEGMRWSPSKYKAIEASMTDAERQAGGHWLYALPLLRYHDRWSQLTAEDFTYWFRRDTVSHNGYLMQTGIRPAGDPHMEPPLADYSFDPLCYGYLDKMTALCKEKGVQLVLVKAPSLYPTWWPEWDAQMVDYAEKNGLLYINLLDAQQEIGIDWSTDTYDTGLHLNVWGAEKLSRYFGAVLTQQCGLRDRRDEPEMAALWAPRVEAYRREITEKTKGETQ